MFRASSAASLLPLTLACFALGVAAGGFALKTEPPPAEARSTHKGEAVPAASVAPAALGLPGAYRARILRVIDGDTVEARVQAWIGHEIVTRLRLAGVDAPELNGACPSERALAARARDRLAELASGEEAVLADIRPDKYFGRVAGRLILRDGRDAGQILLAEALARAGARRFSWC